MSKVNDVLTGGVRVGAAAVAGWAVGVLAKHGLNVNSETAVAVVQGVATSAYYVAVRTAEQVYSKAGWLLLVRKGVAYVEANDKPTA